jgi:hypothetical protein
MMMLAIMILSSYGGGYLLTWMVAPTFQWNYVIILSIIIFVVYLVIYEIGRKYLEQ